MWTNTFNVQNAVSAVNSSVQEQTNADDVNVLIEFRKIPRINEI